MVVISGRQIQILVWKRYLEIKQKPFDYFGNIIASVLLLFEIYLLYCITPSRDPGSLEILLFPLIITSFSQKVLSIIMSDKVTLIIESMRVVGMQISNYYISYFICDGIMLGLITSTISSILATQMSLFYGSPLIPIFLTFLTSILANISFALCFCGLFDSLKSSVLTYTILTTCKYTLSTCT